MKFNQKLQSINIGENKIETDGANKVANTLVLLPNLHSLYIYSIIK